MFLGGKILLTVQKSRKCAYFYKKCRITSLIVEFIKKFLLKLHLQSSLGRGKSWLQWKNICQSKLEKKYFKSNWENISRCRHLATCSHVRPRQTVADQTRFTNWFGRKKYFSATLLKKLTKNV